jgi:glycosyltransferase involved in cell wall biosynthesis
MLKYVLITPARNEQSNLPRLIDSVVSQTLPPGKWIIVDDGSSDATAEIADRAAAEHDWIEVIHRPRQVERSFAGKVGAFNAGYALVQGLDFDVIANIDSDVSFDPGYMEFVVGKFSTWPELGVAGTPFIQDGENYDSAKDSFEGENYVSGGCQFFRRRCFQEIDGYVPNRAGGIDFIAVTKARMKGWQVRCFPEKRYYHYRPLGTAEKTSFRAFLDYGERAYYLGWSPVWHLTRVIYRIPRKPVVLASAGLFWGYCSAWGRRIERPVTDEMIRFHRKEQLRRLRSILWALIRFRKIDSFRGEQTLSKTD